MLHHVIVKLRRVDSRDLSIPDWVAFINDKSRLTTTLLPEIDSIFQNLGLKFWVTREYKPAELTWNAEEINEGLNRTYRLILQQKTSAPVKRTIRH